MPEPDNFILVLLREMGAEMNARFDVVDRRFGQMDERFDRMDTKLDSVKQAAFGESVIGRYMVAEVETRLEEIERRLAYLEHRRD